MLAMLIKLCGFLCFFSQESSDFGLSDVSGPPLFVAARVRYTPPPRRNQNFEIASDFDKNQPQLMKIRKIDSMHLRERVRYS